MKPYIVIADEMTATQTQYTCSQDITAAALRARGRLGACTLHDIWRSVHILENIAIEEIEKERRRQRRRSKQCTSQAQPG